MRSPCKKEKVFMPTLLKIAKPIFLLGTTFLIYKFTIFHHPFIDINLHNVDSTSYHRGCWRAVGSFLLTSNKMVGRKIVKRL